ncbi:MAG: glycine cleavage system aminomethyltransferase GcvT [Saprospiraceae bacterium]|nr:glycine cleavage system aminomethyltransferase GcvT [Saprospiraceae bacterium]
MKTPIYERHLALGARMTEFAGFQMPLLYSNVRDEHIAVRTSAGVFDVSHMGEFIIKGREALDLIQLLTSNDASQLQIGEAQYSCMPNTTGGIMDDLLVYRLDEDQCSAGEKAYMLVVNAGNIRKDFSWIQSHNKFDTRVIDISDQTGLIAVQGPSAVEMIQPLTDHDLASLKYYTFTKQRFAGCDNVLISATGYTGSGGLEIYADNVSILHIWDSILGVTSNQKIVPVGLGARDTLRLEMGYCLYGHDINEETSPIEAGLGWITNLKKGVFHSSHIFSKQKEEGVVRKLVGFTVDDRRVPREGYVIQSIDHEEIGMVTSGTFSPSLEKPIGMGYVNQGNNKHGTDILISTGRKELRATVTKMPFIKI